MSVIDSILHIKKDLEAAFQSNAQNVIIIGPLPNAIVTLEDIAKAYYMLPKSLRIKTITTRIKVHHGYTFKLTTGTNILVNY